MIVISKYVEKVDKKVEWNFLYNMEMYDDIDLYD